MNNWMVRKLRDQHVPKDSTQPKYRDCLIGVLCFPDRLPAMVSCGEINYTNTLCLNEVYSHDGEMYLGQRSLVLINPDELKMLKETGKVLLYKTFREPTVYLLKEVDTVITEVEVRA